MYTSSAFVSSFENSLSCKFLNLASIIEESLILDLILKKSALICWASLKMIITIRELTIVYNTGVGSGTNLIIKAIKLDKVVVPILERAFLKKALLSEMRNAICG